MPEIEFIPEEYIKEKKPERKTLPPPPEARRKAEEFQRKTLGPPPLPLRQRREGVPPPPLPGRNRKEVTPPPLPFRPKESWVLPPLPKRAVERKAVPPPLPPEARKPKLEVVETEKKFEFAGGVSTETSPNHPGKNEDNFFISKKRGFGGVFDGMGGEAAGEVASFEATRTILEQIKNLPEDALAHDAEEKIKDALYKADQQIRKIVELHPEYKGTGCTASIVKVCENGKKVVIGQVGDSRVYRLREGKLERVSPEDSYVEVLKGYGFIENDQDVTQKIPTKEVKKFCAQRLKEAMSLEETQRLQLLDFAIERLSGQKKARLAAERKSFDGNLTISDIRATISNAIDGSGTIKPHVFSLDTKEGDQYIITSDGIHDNLFDQEINNIAQQYQGKPQEMSEALVRASRLRMSEDHERSKNDDATAVVISINKIEAAKKEEVKVKAA